MTDIIRSELPKIIAEIEKSIQRYTEDQEKLGPSRLTSSDQRNYLMNVGTRYHKLVEAALNGPYTDPYFATGHKKLRAEIRRLDDDFA